MVLPGSPLGARPCVALSLRFYETAAGPVRARPGNEKRRAWLRRTGWDEDGASLVFFVREICSHLVRDNGVSSPPLLPKSSGFGIGLHPLQPPAAFKLIINLLSYLLII